MIQRARRTYFPAETERSSGAHTRWSSRSLASKMQHAVFYRLIRTAGLRGAYALLLFVVSWYTLRPSIRKRSHSYLVRRFPNAGPFSLLLHTWKLQWNFGQCLVDRAAAGLGHDFSIESPEENPIFSLAAAGKGVIVLSAHTGCWQLSPGILAKQAPYPVSILAHQEDEDVDKKDFEHRNEQAPYTVIPAHSGPVAVAELAVRLQRGEILCLMGDRTFSGHEKTVFAPFLGKKAPLPLLAYRLAASTGAPIALVLSIRSGAGKGRFYPVKVLRISAGQGRSSEEYARAAGCFAGVLEEYTRQYPYQFFNFFNFWE